MARRNLKVDAAAGSESEESRKIPKVSGREIEVEVEVERDNLIDNKNGVQRKREWDERRKKEGSRDKERVRERKKERKKEKK